MKFTDLSKLRLGEALKLSRPYLWLLTATPFAAGYLVTDGRISTIFWLSLIYFVFPYNLLFHGLEPDLVRPAKWLGTWLAVSNLPLLAWLLAIAAPAPRMWLVAALLTALAYGLRSVRFKEVPLLDALSWGFAISAPLVFGFLLGGWQPDFLPSVLSFFGWAVASHAFETIQTLEQDKQFGGHSTATWLGASATTILCTALYLVSATLPVVFYGRWGIAAAMLLALYSLNTIRFIGVVNPELFSLGWRTYLKLNYLTAAILAIMLILAPI